MVPVDNNLLHSYNASMSEQTDTKAPENRDFKIWTPEQQAFAINTQKVLERVIKDRNRSNPEAYKEAIFFSIANAEAYLKGQPSNKGLAMDGLSLAIQEAKERSDSSEPSEMAAGAQDLEILSNYWTKEQFTAK